MSTLCLRLNICLGKSFVPKMLWVSHLLIVYHIMNFIYIKEVVYKHNFLNIFHLKSVMISFQMERLRSV